jgi:hypothetical protein
MNITVDKTNKTITVEEDMNLTDFKKAEITALEESFVDDVLSYKITATKKVTEYIPVSVYPSYPILPYPYPYYQPYQPQPNPFLPPYTITCTLKGNVQ